ncbi:MAG TPA: PA14 domain-containing protein, partial [Verrucomicrobiae bacterium]
MRTQNTWPLGRKVGFYLAILSWAFVVGICLHVLTLPALAGSITREVFTGIGGGTVADLTNSPAYPNSPTSTNLVTDFFEAPTDIDDNYGTRMHGYIVPPVTGNYTFWIATDDGGALFLSTDEKPANMQQIATVPGWAASRNWTAYPQQQSAAIPLQAGKAYYISALQKEAGTGDNLAVRWLRPDAVDEGPIPATYLLPWGTSFTKPQITQQPADTTVVEGSMANFTVQISNLDSVSYQWYKNGTAIPGATSQTLSYGPAALGDEGLGFRVTISNSLGSTNSNTATLHVTPDTTKPTITQVINLSSTSLQVTFSEPVDSTGGTFQLDGGVTVNLASPGTDPRTVTLFTSAMTMGSTYTLTVSNVKDKAATPNTILPGSQISFIAIEFVSQNIGGTGGTLNRVADEQFDVNGAGKDIG